MSLASVAVLGGGIAGLAAAHTLREALPGAEITVLEAGTRPGGKVGTVAERGYVTEDGPNSVLDHGGVLRALAGDVPFVEAPRSAAKRFVYLGGRLVAAPGGPGELATTQLLSLGAKLRLACEPLLAKRRPAADESLLDFAVRHLGAEAGGLVARLAARGVHGGDEATLSVRAGFPRLAALDERHRSVVVAGVAGMLHARNGERPPRAKLGTFDGGLGAVPTALAARLDEHLVLGARVTRLAPRPGGWDLAWDGPRAGTGRVDAVVLALPARAAAELLLHAAPVAAEALSEIGASPMAVAHLGYRREAVDHPLDGFGALSGDDSLGALGVLFSSTMWPDRAPPGCVLLTVMLGGALAPHVASLPEGDLLALARDAAGRAVGAKGEPDYARLVRWPAAIPRYSLGHAARVATVEQALAPLPPLALAGASFHGVSMVEAAKSGVAAARALAAR